MPEFLPVQDLLVCDVSSGRGPAWNQHETFETQAALLEASVSCAQTPRTTVRGMIGTRRMMPALEDSAQHAMLVSIVNPLVATFERCAELVFLGQGETGGERLHTAGAGGFGK